MRLRDKVLVSGVAVSLVLAVTLVVTGNVMREPAGSLARIRAVTDGVRQDLPESEQPGMSVAHTTAVARTRAPADVQDDHSSFVDATRRRDGRKREAAFLAEFLKLRAEQGSAAFERTVGEVLASKREPQCRKVAGLRALHSAGVPGTDAVLAAAVESQADVSDGSSLSVPRYALNLLFERAPTGEDARRVLARLAFVPQAGLSADLRREASTALAGSIRGPRHDEVVRLLRLETTPAQLDAALEALSRDTNFGAAKPPLAALGAEPGSGVAPVK